MQYSLQQSSVFFDLCLFLHSFQLCLESSSCNMQTRGCSVSLENAFTPRQAGRRSSCHHSKGPHFTRSRVEHLMSSNRYPSCRIFKPAYLRLFLLSMPYVYLLVLLLTRVLHAIIRKFSICGEVTLLSQ